MTGTRRDLFKIAGGAALGVAFTPVPWRLITDAALLSETWPGIPKPARGEIRAKYTNCALCPAGCAVKARCVGEQPVSLAGVAGHSLSRGALCAFGLAGHHLPYHPARVKQALVKEAMFSIGTAVAKRGPRESVALLDLRPGRTASWTHRRAMKAMKNGLYVAASPTREFGVNLHGAKTVLSLGAPLMDGWGTPGNVLAARENFRLIQAEALESRTAVVADEWLPIQAGSERALALGLANVLRGRPADAETMAQTGLKQEQIAALAKELAENGPAVVVDDEMSPAVLALNSLLGGLGRTIVARGEAPVPERWNKEAAPVTGLAAVPDYSVAVLLIDESMGGDYVPWNAIARKLLPNATVAVFGWTAEGYGRHAQHVLPTAVYPEITDDVPAAIDDVRAVFRMANALVPPPTGTIVPAEFVGHLAGIAPARAMEDRVEAIRASGRGELYTYATGASSPVKDMKPEEFWKALNSGACWLDSAETKAPKLAMEHAAAEPGPRENGDLPLVAVFAEPRNQAALETPLMTKLHRESKLRLDANRVAVHPTVASAAGIADNGRATLHTACGSVAVAVTVDASVPPGVVALAGGAGLCDVCGASTRAKVVRV